MDKRHICQASSNDWGCGDELTHCFGRTLHQFFVHHSIGAKVANEGLAEGLGARRHSTEFEECLLDLLGPLLRRDPTAIIRALCEKVRAVGPKKLEFQLGLPQVHHLGERRIEVVDRVPTASCTDAVRSQRPTTLRKSLLKSLTCCFLP